MPMPANRRVDRAAVVAGLPAGHGRTNAQVDAALAQVNQDAVYDAERARWTTDVWDRASPINGVPAEHFLDRADVDENGTDDIVLVRDAAGTVVMFQPHEPEVAGLVRIPKGQGQTRGRSMADTVAAGRAQAEVVRQVIARLG